MVFVVVGIALHAMGWLFGHSAQDGSNPGAVFLVMFGSVVTILFGVYRIATGSRGG
jgi:hypothetical protein